MKKKKPQRKHLNVRGWIGVFFNDELHAGKYYSTYSERKIWLKRVLSSEGVQKMRGRGLYIVIAPKTSDKPQKP